MGKRSSIDENLPFEESVLNCSKIRYCLLFLSCCVEPHLSSLAIFLKQEHTTSWWFVSIETHQTSQSKHLANCKGGVLKTDMFAATPYSKLALKVRFTRRCWICWLLETKNINHINTHISIHIIYIYMNINIHLVPINKHISCQASLATGEELWWNLCIGGGSALIPCALRDSKARRKVWGEDGKAKSSRTSCNLASDEGKHMETYF